MYYPSEPGSMTQTNRQKHPAAMVLRSCGVGNLDAAFAPAKFSDSSSERICGRPPSHSRPERDASIAQIVMYHPSKPGSTTQTNRQKHPAAMVVRSCGVGNLDAAFAP